MMLFMDQFLHLMDIKHIRNITLRFNISTGIPCVFLFTYCPTLWRYLGINITKVRSASLGLRLTLCRPHGLVGRIVDHGRIVVFRGFHNEKKALGIESIDEKCLNIW